MLSQVRHKSLPYPRLALVVAWLALVTTPMTALAESSSGGGGSSDNNGGGNPQLQQAQQLLTTEANAINQANQQNAQTLQSTEQQLQQQQQDNDRKKQQQTAQALGALGAGIAGMGCIMMMIAAQKQQDPSLKMMMMAQAMQQCAQAAASAANAAQNGSGSQQLTEPSPSSVAQLTAPTLTPEPTYNPVNIPTPGANQLADNNAGQPPSVFDQATPSDTPSVLTEGNGNGTAQFTAASTSDLAPIPDQAVTYDESAKSGAASSGSGTVSGSSPGITTLASSGTTVDTSKAGATATQTGSTKSRGTDNGAIADGGGSPGGVAAGSGGDGGASPEQQSLNSMLAGLMGGQQGAAGGGPREDIVYYRPGAAKTGERPPNIFQYAAYRFKKLSKETTVQRLARARLGQQRAPHSDLAKMEARTGPARRAAAGKLEKVAAVKP